MPIFEAVRLAFESIRSQKLKSVFSAIGVMVGVMFLIAVVSIVQGMNVYVETKVTGLVGGVNNFQVRQRPNITRGGVGGVQWLAWQRRPQINMSDAAYISDIINLHTSRKRCTIEAVNGWGSAAIYS